MLQSAPLQSSPHFSVPHAARIVLRISRRQCGSLHMLHVRMTRERKKQEVTLCRCNCCLGSSFVRLQLWSRQLFCYYVVVSTVVSAILSLSIRPGPCTDHRSPDWFSLCTLLIQNFNLSMSGSHVMNGAFFLIHRKPPAD